MSKLKEFSSILSSISIIQFVHDGRKTIIQSGMHSSERAHNLYSDFLYYFKQLTQKYEFMVTPVLWEAPIKKQTSLEFQEESVLINYTPVFKLTIDSEYRITVFVNPYKLNDIGFDSESVLNIDEGFIILLIEKLLKLVSSKPLLTSNNIEEAINSLKSKK